MPFVFQSPNGERLVILPEAEYRALIAGTQPSFENPQPPPFVVEAIRSGMTPLKALRIWRGLTQKRIAEETGLSDAFLSRVERGRRPLGPKAQAGVAKALKVPENWLRTKTD